MSAAAPTHAASPAKLPVPWDVVSFVAGGQNPDFVAGANDFDCKPDRAHPRPVVLVHGLIATQGDNWRTMSPLLKNEGFCVFALTYGRPNGSGVIGGLSPMQQSATELAAFVDRVLAKTGSKQIDLVGHSEGTVMPRWWLAKLGGAPKVHTYVQLTPLWPGTNVAGIGNLLAVAKLLGPGAEPGVLDTFKTVGCGSCPQFAVGSSYMKAVNAPPGPAIASIRYTTVVTKYDELVNPYTNGILKAPNVDNHVLQDICPTDFAEHAAVAFDPMAAQLMLNALAPTRARKVPCVTMLPTGPTTIPPVGLDPPTDFNTCTTGRAVRFKVKRARGERIRMIRVSVRGAAVASRRGRSLRRITVRKLAPGRQRLRVVIRSTRGRRTVVLRRTVRCA